MRSLLCFVLLLAACDPVSDPVPDGPTDATPAPVVAEETPMDSPSTEPTPGAEPTPQAAAPVGDPWTQQTTRKASSTYDTITFWGWSADGNLYAFETVDPGPGATECEGRYDLFVVDARTDSYAPGGHASLTHDEPEPKSGVCTPKNLAGAWGPKREAVLDKHGIVRGALRGPATYQAVDDSGQLWEIATPSGPIQVHFSVNSPGREAVMREPAAGAAYTLKMRRGGGDWTVVEPGTRVRETVHNYALNDAFAFFSPDGKHAALFVSRVHLSFEGDRVTWMSNGVVVP